MPDAAADQPVTASRDLEKCGRGNAPAVLAGAAYAGDDPARWSRSVRTHQAVAA